MRNRRNGRHFSGNAGVCSGELHEEQPPNRASTGGLHRERHRVSVSGDGVPPHPDVDGSDLSGRAHIEIQAHDGPDLIASVSTLTHVGQSPVRKPTRDYLEFLGLQHWPLLLSVERHDINVGVHLVRDRRSIRRHRGVIVPRRSRRELARIGAVGIDDEDVAAGAVDDLAAVGRPSRPILQHRIGRGGQAHSIGTVRIHHDDLLALNAGFTTGGIRNVCDA